MVPITHIPCTCTYVIRFDDIKSVDVNLSAYEQCFVLT